MMGLRIGAGFRLTGRNAAWGWIVLAGVALCNMMWWCFILMGWALYGVAWCVGRICAAISKGIRGGRVKSLAITEGKKSAEIKEEE